MLCFTLASILLTGPITQAAMLSPEEIAFAARLQDAHRRYFVEALSEEERKEVMAFAKEIDAEHPGDEAIAECKVRKKEEAR